MQTRKIQSPYKLLGPKDVIDYIVVKKLTKSMQHNFYLAYGLDLDNPKRSPGYRKEILGYLLQTMRRYVSEVNEEIKNRNGDRSFLQEGADLEKTLLEAKDYDSNTKHGSLYLKLGKDEKIVNYVVVKGLDERDQYFLYLRWGVNLATYQQLDAKTNMSYNLALKHLIERIAKVEEFLSSGEINEDFLTEDVDLFRTLTKFKTYSWSQLADLRASRRGQKIKPPATFLNLEATIKREEEVSYQEDSKQEEKKKEAADLKIKKQELIVVKEILTREKIKSQEEFLKILQSLFLSLKEPNYLELLSKYEIDEVVIFLLMMQTVGNYTAKEIANFMHKSEEDVLMITKKILACSKPFQESVSQLVKLLELEKNH